MKKTLTSILAVYFLLISCGHSNDSNPSSTTTATTIAVPASSPTANTNGELLAAVDSTAGAKISGTALQSASNDPLSQFTSVEIPAGALSKSSDVKIFETASLAQQVSANSFGLTEITKAGPSIVIQSDAVLSQPIKVSVPYSSSLQLASTEEIAVLVLSGSTIEIFNGKQIELSDKTVSVLVDHFGVFQVIRYEGIVQQQKATSQVSDSSLKSVVAEVASTVTATPTPAPAPAATTTAATTAATTTTVATPTPTVTEVEGTWSIACRYISDDQVYLKESLAFSGTEMVSTNKTYSDSGCSTLLYTEISAYTFSLGTSLDSNSMKTLSFVGVSWTVTPNNASGVQKLQSSGGTWGSVNWQVSTAHNIYTISGTEEQVGDSYTVQSKVSGATLTFDGTSYTKE